ncbi:RND transporter MFP subunit [Cellvibrio zantedeschiae]|uniref:RND transporter MFP subunit n=1 Tax=Cellvibrio zantedeschiae TaxID=1237077 RepID=A0ABQ3B5W0_9GAMM|nr:efflux RND transporter periplasmic adaptor subunit [Cellvibrio zantedeschiae]GGY79939.1 RND transporter MFP subunit [Cellvibrio zantedeschiae]
MIKGTEQQDIPLVSKAKKSTMRITAISAAVLSIFGAAVWFYADGPNASLVMEKDQVQIASVSRGDLVRDLAVQGKVVAANAPTLFSQAEGQIRFIKQPGEAVNMGDLIALVESPTLKNEVAQQQALLSSMKSEMERSQLNAREQQLDMEQLRNSAQVNLQAAKRNLARAEQSIAIGVIRKVDFEIARDAMEKAEMEFIHAQHKVALASDKLKFEQRASEQSLARQTLAVEELERKLASLQIKAPVTGQVGNWLAGQESRVAEGSGLLTVIDLGQYEAEIYIPENYAAELSPGLAVEISYNGEKLPGTLNHVAPEVKEGSVSARVRFNQNDAKSLRQNQRLSARILFEEKRNVLRVARGDFVSSGGGHSLYKVEQNLAVRVPVELGALSVQWVELVKGVKEGDRIVISNVQAFKNVERVRLN